MTLLTVEDFADEPAVQDMSSSALQEKITDAEAIAKSLYLPVLHDANFPHKDAAKAIIKRAIVYDVKNGDNRTQSQTAGSYQITEFAPLTSGTLFNEAQVKALKALNTRVSLPGVYTVGVSRW